MGVTDTEPANAVNGFPQNAPTAPVMPQQGPVVVVDPFVVASLQTAEMFGIPVRWKRTLSVTIIRAIGIIGKNKNGTSDVYCSLSIAGRERNKTRTVEKTVNPVWNASYAMPLCGGPPFPQIILSLLNSNMIFSDDPLGFAELEPHRLLENQEVIVPLPIANGTGTLEVKALMTSAVPDDFSFYLDHQFFSFGDFWINDFLTEKNIFRVEGSWPNEFFFRDVRGRDLLRIKKRSLFAIEPSYDFYLPGQSTPRMECTRLISFFGATYTINGPNGPLTVEGDCLNWSYSFRDCSGRIVASVRSEMMRRYSISIAPNQELPLILACVLVIDMTKKR